MDDLQDSLLNDNDEVEIHEIAKKIINNYAKTCFSHQELIDKLAEAIVDLNFKLKESNYYPPASKTVKASNHL